MSARARRILLTAALLAMGALLLEWLVDPAHLGFDVASYYTAAGALLDGRSPYGAEVSGPVVSYAGEGAYRYPPLFAALFLPLAHLPFATVALIGCLTAAALYAVGIALVAREAGASWPWWLPALVLVGPLTDWIFGFGNASVALIVAVLGADLAERADRPRLGGLLIAVAVMTKLTPALLLLYYAARGRWAIVRAALLSLALLLALSLLLFPAATIEFPGILLGAVRGGEGTHPAHAGLAWMAARLGASAELIRLTAIAVVLFALVATVLVARRLAPERAWPIVLLLAFFAAPSLWPQSGLLLPLATARLAPLLPPDRRRVLLLGGAAGVWTAIALLPDPGKPLALWVGAGLLVFTALAARRVAPPAAGLPATTPPPSLAARRAVRTDP